MQSPRLLTPEDFSHLASVGLRMESATLTRKGHTATVQYLEVESPVKVLETFGEDTLKSLLNGSQSLPTACKNNVGNRIAAGERWTDSKGREWLCNVFNGTRAERDNRPRYFFNDADFNVMGYTFNRDELKQVSKMAASGATLEEIQSAGFEVY